MRISHKRVKMKNCCFCIMLKVLWNNTQIHSSIVALVIQQNNSKVPCFTLYTQLCTKNWGRKNTRSICPRAILSFSNILYYSLFHISLQGKKKFIFSSRYEKRWLSGKLFCDLHVFKTTTSKSTRKLCYIYGTRNLTNWYNINNSF